MRRLRHRLYAGIALGVLSILAMMLGVAGYGVGLVVAGCCGIGAAIVVLPERMQ